MTSCSLLLMPAPAIRPTLARATASAAGCLLLLMRSSRPLHIHPRRPTAVERYRSTSLHSIAYGRHHRVHTRVTRPLFVYFPPPCPSPRRRETLALPVAYAMLPRCDAMS